MKRFIIEESNERIVTHSGLAFIGYLLHKTQLRKRFTQSKVPDCRIPPDISHTDLAFSYIGLLSQGKSDFDHIEPFRKEDFFAMALDIEDVPSSATLR